MLKLLAKDVIQQHNLDSMEEYTDGHKRYFPSKIMGVLLYLAADWYFSEMSIFARHTENTNPLW